MDDHDEDDAAGYDVIDVHDDDVDIDADVVADDDDFVVVVVVVVVDDDDDIVVFVVGVRILMMLQLMVLSVAELAMPTFHYLKEMDP